MPRRSVSTYPPDWPAIAQAVKADANWHCVCGWVRSAGNASHYQMLSAATKAAQQRWLDITSVFGDVQAIDVVNDQGELVWRGSREEAQP